MSDLFKMTGVGSEISAVLGRLSKSISKATTLPVLSCVQLDIRTDGVYATVSNLDQWHEARIPVDAAGDIGAGLCVRLDLLQQLLAQCNGEGVSLSAANDEEMTVEVQGRSATLRTLPLAEFPDAPDRSEAVWEDLAPRAMSDALKTVRFCCSTDETRYVLNGVYFSSDPRKVVATDGRRLASLSLDFPVGLDDVILPSPVIPLWIEIGGRVDELQVAAVANGIALRAEGEMIWTKKIEGRYPNFQQVIPNFSNALKIVGERERLLEALSWAQVVMGSASSRNSSVKVTGSSGESWLEVFASIPDIGEASERVPLVEEIGRDFNLGCDVVFLREMLQVTSEGKAWVEIEPDSEGVVNSPVVFRRSSDDFIGIVMPMRVA